jgi:hypothetical protein
VIANGKEPTLSILRLHGPCVGGTVPGRRAAEFRSLLFVTRPAGAGLWRPASGINPVPTKEWRKVRAAIER